MAHTILRCQAIIVLISLQLCLITSLEANLHSEKEPAFTEGIYKSHCNVQKMETSQREARETHLTASLRACLCYAALRFIFIHL